MSPIARPLLRGLATGRQKAAVASPWVCRQCCSRTRQSRRWHSSDSLSSSTAAADKPYYVTTPIFYVNAAPHIGHLYTMIVADVFKRWQQLQGKQAYLCTGTDEHGMKIQQAAAKQEIPVKEFCDENSQKFRDLAAAVDLSHDFFIRTTDEEHKHAVSEFWLQLKNAAPDQLGIYKGSHEGWYCVSDECFYPDELVQPSIVAQTGRKIMVSVETDNEVEWVKEQSWFFPLKKYKQRLLDFYDANPDWITPQAKMNEVRYWVENHLEDLSITRPASRLNWGIRDPDDPSQTIYVWVDALINYLTKAGYSKDWHMPQDDTGIWPADLHVVGKDIIRFHAVYWPALLMALNMPLPRKILCHNHWTMSGRKMSKSIGNVVNPFFAIQRWEVDPLRYFLMRNGQFHKDMSYSNQLIAPIYAKELQANIGNLFQRVARPRRANYSVTEAVVAYKEGKCRASGASGCDFAALESSLRNTPDLVKEAMDNMDTGTAVRHIYELLRETNRFISDSKFWEVAGSAAGSEERAVLHHVVFHACEALRIAAILLQPIMPTKMSQLLSMLGVDASRRTFNELTLGADLEYGTPEEQESAASRTGQRWVGTLFPPKPDVDELEKSSARTEGTGRKQSRSKVYNRVADLEAESKS